MEYFDLPWWICERLSIFTVPLDTALLNRKNRAGGNAERDRKSCQKAV